MLVHILAVDDTTSRTEVSLANSLNSLGHQPLPKVYCGLGANSYTEISVYLFPLYHSADQTFLRMCPGPFSAGKVERGTG